MKFFEERKGELTGECFNRLYKELKYEFIEKRHTVFNLGDMGRNFYIIIQGKVSILLKKKGLEENPDEKFAKHEDEEVDGELSNEIVLLDNKNKKNMLKKILQYENNQDPNLQKEILEMSEEDYINIRYPSFFLMRKMQNGESFGEIALRQNVPRYLII